VNEQALVSQQPTFPHPGVVLHNSAMELSYHGARTQSYKAELSNEIWLMVLDLVRMLIIEASLLADQTTQIPLKADLKALCLTSKTLCALALPYLYATMWIKAWDAEAVAMFFRSIGCGAGRHFNKTKTLVLEMDEPTNESNLAILGSQASHSRGDSYYPLGLKYSSDHIILFVKQFFLKSEVLRSFR
jgi:hypothetical protein